MLKKRKSQAAMEFLMTYGWAILVVLVVIVALAYFGILTPGKFLPETCTLMPGLSCTDFKVNTAGIAITVMNGYGKKFSTFSIKIEGEAGDPCVGEILTAVNGLDNGETETLRSTCSIPPGIGNRLKADLLINYQKAGGLSHSKSGSFVSLVESGEFYGSPSEPGTSCKNILEIGFEEDGFYFIDPDGDGGNEAFEVYCDMTTGGGGWTLVWHGLPTQARYLLSDGQQVNLGNNIQFNEMQVKGVNLNFDVTTTTTETAVLEKTIPEYYNEVGTKPDNPPPRVYFHDTSGIQDVSLTNNYFFFGYGNGWRVFYTCINVAGTAYMYIGGSYSPGCTPRSSFVPIDVGCAGGGYNYCSNSLDDNPKDSGLGLSKREYQETKVWIR